MNISKLTEQLERQEGVELKPYTDTVGKTSIGVGRNLDDRGISEDEAVMMLHNDIDYFYNELKSRLGFFSYLSDARQNVLVNMAFNLGVAGLMSFKMTLQLIRFGQYEAAAEEMLNSKWANQVGNRAIELSEQMRAGEYQ